MSDNVATRRRQRVADTLRERILRLEEIGYQEKEPMLIQTLIACADQIDAEHERRMEDCRRETRRSTCNYISRVVADYKRGKKWKRKYYGDDE